MELVQGPWRRGSTLIKRFATLDNTTSRHSIYMLWFKFTAYFLTDLNRSFEMSSFVETGATAILKESPVEFVKYPLIS